ncbi:hypothetical protein EON65_53850 [archaeon]|nr:MAG: hypothetical protein EON65_53850 [archaeon]
MFNESSDSDDEHRQLLSSISNMSNLPHHMEFHMMNNYPQASQQTPAPIIEINRTPAKKGRTGVVWSAQFVSNIHLFNMTLSVECERTNACTRIR